MDWYQGNNDYEKEPPRSGWKRVFYILVNYTGKLVVINLLFLISCIPIVTVPAAVSALNAYVGKIFRVGFGMDCRDYWKEYRAGLVKNLPLGILTGVIGFYAYYLLSLANNFDAGQKDVVTGIGLGVLAIAVLLGAYTFVLTSMVNLPCRHIVRNAFILMIVEWKTSILVLLESLIFLFIMLAMVPYSLFFFIVIGMSLQQLVICAMIQPVIQKRVISPNSY